MKENKQLMWITFLVGLIFVIVASAMFAVRLSRLPPKTVEVGEKTHTPEGDATSKPEHEQSNMGSFSSFVETVLASIGCSMIAAVAFAFLYQSTIDAYVKSGMVQDIASSIDKGMDRHFEEQRRSQRDLSPRQAFPASDAPIRKYNDFYNDALRRTVSLKYKGDKASYIAYRLHKHLTDHSPALSVELILPKVSLERLYTSRAGTLINCPVYRGQEKDAIAEGLRLDVLAAVTAFFDMRDQINFSFFFCEELPFLRYEITDCFLVLSVLPMQEHGYFPPTLIYDRESLFYSSFATNFEQIKGLCGPNDILRRGEISEGDIADLIQSSGLKTDIDALRQRYKDYFAKASFAKAS